jgi:UPF0716 protein FxsA
MTGNGDLQGPCEDGFCYYIDDMWLLLFIAVPAVELYLLIEVGGRIGVLQTIFIIIGTGVIGWTLIKIQGIATLHRIREQVGEGQVPAIEMVSGLVLLGAALLLLTPGFITDTIGFAALIPQLRRVLAARLIHRYKSRVVHPGERMGPFGL